MQFLLYFLMFAVVVVLFVGIIGFSLNTKYSQKHSNRLMRWRLYLQAAALVIAFIVIYFASQG